MTVPFYRRRSGKKIAGVCAGLAGPLDVDVDLVRVVFVMMAFLAGYGLLVYAVLWLYMPAGDRPVLTRRTSSRSGVAPQDTPSQFREANRTEMDPLATL